MKSKEKVYLGIIGIIFAFVGIILYTKYGPGKNVDKSVKVEVITPIAAEFNQQALTTLSDPTKSVHYVPNIPLDNRNNPNPFGPLR